MTAARSRRVGRPPGRAKKYGPERGPSDAVGRRLSTRWKSAESGASAPTTSAQQPRVPGLVFPTLQAVQGLETSRGHGPHAEGGTWNACRQEVNTVGFEPCQGM